MHTQKQVVHKFLTPDSIAFGKFQSTSHILLYHFALSERLPFSNE